MVAVLMAAAALTAPPGFAEARALEPAASFVAGKPAVVYCANTTTSWREFLTSTYGSASNANGSAVPGSDRLFLSWAACSNLVAKQPAITALGPSVLALTHEAIHLRGETDEGATDCAAVHEMPRVAVRFFRVKAGKQLRALMAAAWSFRGKEAAAYRSVC